MDKSKVARFYGPWCTGYTSAFIMYITLLCHFAPRNFKARIDHNTTEPN